MLNIKKIACLILIFSILVATPLEGMHKTCPHQTLYTTAQQNKNSFKFLKNVDLKPNDLLFSEEARFYMFVKNVFLDNPISPRFTEKCRRCEKYDAKFQNEASIFGEKLEAMTNMIKNEQHFEITVKETEKFLKPFSIIKQLRFLFEIQKTTQGPDLRLWIGASKGFMALIFLISPLVLPTRTLFLETPWNKIILGVFVLMMYSYIVAMMVALVFDAQIPHIHKTISYFNDSKNDRKLKLLDHCIREIRRLNQHTHGYSEVAQQAHSKYNDIAFSFK